MTIVRENLMNREGYTPYCGEQKCKVAPRTFFNGRQFECKSCGWQSQFEPPFIREYKDKWGIADTILQRPKKELGAHHA